MTHLLASSASNSAELSRRLEEWGAKAPARLDRRGKEQQKRLERWCLKRFLSALMDVEECDFPVRVYERENPDFEVHFGAMRFGLEVTEAVDEDEQKEDTWRAKRQKDIGESIYEPVPPEWITGKRFSKIVSNAINRKEKIASIECHELLLYLNTFDTLDVELAEQLQDISTVYPVSARFCRIWVLTSKGLLELVENRVVHTNSEFRR